MFCLPSIEVVQQLAADVAADVTRIVWIICNLALKVINILPAVGITQSFSLRLVNHSKGSAEQTIYITFENKYIIKKIIRFI